MYDSLLFFLSLASIAFLTDSALFFSFHTQCIYLVLHLYLFQLLAMHHPQRLILLGTLLALESFMFYSILWAPLIALVPLTILEIKVRHNFYQSKWYTLGVGTAFLVAQILIIEPFFIGLPLRGAYTFLKLCGNLLIVGIVSLKDFNQDKRDNRPSLAKH